MAYSATYSLIVPGGTRSFGDDNWRETERAYVDAWKAAISLLREREIMFDRIHYRISIDWSPLLRRHERHYAAMAYIEKGGSKDIGRRLHRARFPRRPSKIVVNAQTSVVDGMKKLESIVEAVLHDVFLIMNIAAPGCCNFYRASLVGDKSSSAISLSGSEFELCVLPYQKRPQSAGFVSVATVAAWYQSIRSTPAQVPSSSSERTLFALLHLARLDSDMLSVVWLFYAFESLLQTKVGENYAAIVRRLALLLQLAGDDAATMKKQMRALYDLRSAIVHGGFETIHPMRDEVLDKRVNDVYSRLLSASEYGLLILITVLQKMAEAGRAQLEFDEVLLAT